MTGASEIEKKCTKKTGIKTAIRRALTTDSEIVNQIVQLVREAVSKKAYKRYPPGTDLIVMFEDRSTVREVIGDTLQKSCTTEIAPMKLPFRRVYFVGWFKGIYVTGDLAGCPE